MEVMSSDEFRRRYVQQDMRVVGSRKRRKGKTDWVEELLLQIRAAGLPEPRREYRFHAKRKWRFDMDWKRHGRLVACEVEGGTWMKTSEGHGKGHAHPVRYEQDCEKYSEAAIYGWAVIRVTPNMITDGRAIELLTRALENE